MDKGSVCAFGVYPLNGPSEVAGPGFPSLVSEHGSPTGNLLASIEVPEKKLIGSTSGLQIAAIP